MTTLRMKNTKTNEIRIIIFKSTDKLKKFIAGMFHKNNDKKTFFYSYVVGTGKNKETIEEVLDGVGYDQNDEAIEVFRRYGIIPREDDYVSNIEQ